MATAAKKTGTSGKKATGKRQNAAKKPAQAKKNTKNTSAAKKQVQEPVKRDQHREIWVVVTFFLSLVLIFAMLGVDGGILTPLSNFLKGLFGFGAYILPFFSAGLLCDYCICPWQADCGADYLRPAASRACGDAGASDFC